jgi:DNA-binding NtrC family response regulator
MASILVVDDDPDHLELTLARLRTGGHEPIGADSPARALELFQSEPLDLLLTDLEMPEMSGLDLLREVKESDPTVPVVVLTGHATVGTAVEAMKTGAFDYLQKPIHAPDLLVVIERALREKELVSENIRLRQELRDKYHHKNLVGTSARMREVFRLVEKIGPTSSTALILGESGTGKELVARAIHEASARSHRRFVRVNCSAITETLLESELFGHERGSFTGAFARKKGLFEIASGGTLFLDEIGDTPPGVQAELLRVLQEGEIRRVGGTEDIVVDVRVITATNQDLKKQIAEGRFREDLYYRLNVVSLQLPPLRERKEDIPLLVEHFLQKKAGGGEHPRPDPRVLALFNGYPWPGNVRELENVIERALVLCEDNTLTAHDLPEDLRVFIGSTGPEDFPTPSEVRSPPLDLARASLEEMERRHIEQVLIAVEGHREKAAQTLGISRRTLYEKIKRYHLGRREFS